jgi:hypothetical protein
MYIHIYILSLLSSLGKKKVITSKVDYINNSMERSYADPQDSDTDDEDGVMELLGTYIYKCIFICS